MTSSLPVQLDSPVGLVRRRLTDRIPPHLPAAPAPGTPARRVMTECTECGAGPPEALSDGLCRPCRNQAVGSTPTAPAEPPAERDLRHLLKAP
ncbi:hypothetical protein ACWEF9_01110 [Streptomyces sp. NPDC004980]